MKQFKLSISLCVLLATAIALPRGLLALSINSDGEDFLDDLEPDDVTEPEGVEGSGDQLDELSWVLHTRAGVTIKASSLEIEQLRQSISEQKEKLGNKDIDLAASVGQLQMEDGPSKLIEDEEQRQNRRPFQASERQEFEVMGEYLKEITATNFYPEYGVGILENGCTAFMIGPKHALTTANCVYNREDQTWEKGLKFWRGRNGDRYISKIQWSSVIIPDEFYSLGKLEKNWALIKFESESPVWLRIAHSNKLKDVAMTVYGYLPDDRPYGTMYNSICRSDLYQAHIESLNIQCGTRQKFSGGPILKGYNFMRSKMPLVYAISVSYDYSYAHQAVRIHEDLFWSLCYFMRQAGHDMQCGRLEY